MPRKRPQSKRRVHLTEAGRHALRGGGWAARHVGLSDEDAGAGYLACRPEALADLAAGAPWVASGVFDPDPAVRAVLIRAELRRRVERWGKIAHGDGVAAGMAAGHIFAGRLALARVLGVDVLDLSPDDRGPIEDLPWDMRDEARRRAGL